MRYVEYQYELFQTMVKYRKTIQVVGWISRGLGVLLLVIFGLGSCHKRLPDYSEGVLWGLFVAWCVLLVILILLLISLYFLQQKFNEGRPRLKLEYIFLQIENQAEPYVLGPLLLIGVKNNRLLVQYPGSQEGVEVIPLTSGQQWFVKTVEEVLAWKKDGE